MVSGMIRDVGDRADPGPLPLAENRINKICFHHKRASCRR